MQILLADDDEDDRFFFSEALSELQSDITYKEVMDGAELMDYLKENSHAVPELLFLDMNMPCKSGSECLSEIRSENKFRDLVIIIYSTSSEMEEVKRAYSLGADLYLQKPSRFETLKSLLSEIITKDFSKDNPADSLENFLWKE